MFTFTRIANGNFHGLGAYGADFRVKVCVGDFENKIKFVGHLHSLVVKPGTWPGLVNKKDAPPKGFPRFGGVGTTNGPVGNGASSRLINTRIAIVDQ